MSKGRQKNTIEYHPEFLYFNKYVRENGYTPDKDSWVWASFEDEEEDLSPYELCNLLLFNLVPSGKKAWEWTRLLNEIIEKNKVFNFPKNVDVNRWIQYVNSLDISGMLDRYVPSIFQAFGESLDIPTIKVSVARLNPCSSNHFNSIINGAFEIRHITRCDPPFYDIGSHIIYLPVPETSINLPELCLDWWLVHEILHSTIRPFYKHPFQIGEYRFVDYPPDTLRRAFSEVFCEVGAAYTILGLKGKAPNKKQLSILKNHLINNNLYLDAFARMQMVGFDFLCGLLRPTIRISRELAFLARECTAIKKMTEKQMRGVLTKKYSYKKPVKGMDKKVLEKRLKKHQLSRINNLVDQISNLDIHRLLKGAAASTDNKRKKGLLKELSELFDPQMKEKWDNANIY